MTDTKENSSKSQAPIPDGKKTYRAPKLQKFGKLYLQTQGMSGLGTEGMSGMTMA